jgi:hypothetical protein
MAEPLISLAEKYSPFIALGQSRRAFVVLENGFKLGYNIPFTLGISESSEALVREYLMRWWTKRLDARRRLLKAEYETAGKKRRAEIALDRAYILDGNPADLSGACKLVSQFCHIAFQVPDSTIMNNGRHSFLKVRIANPDNPDNPLGVVYDLNRRCYDVQCMWSWDDDETRLDKLPYTSAKSYQTNMLVPDPDVPALGPKQLSGMQTWHEELETLVNGFIGIVLTSNYRESALWQVKLQTQNYLATLKHQRFPEIPV